jgi:hypothetical protein
MRSFYSRISWILVATALIAGPAWGQIIPAGTDAFSTATGTMTDFAANPLPAGFFCPGSAPFAGGVKFVGEPLVTNPPGAVGNGDTLVVRLTAADLSSGMAIVPVKVKAISMRSQDVISIGCGDGTITNWIVRACLCGCDCGGGDQPQTELKLTLDNPSCGCGFAEGELELNVCLRFVNVDTGEVRGPVQQNVTLTVSHMPFCMKPPPGALVATEPFEVDTDCDDSVDCFMPGSEKFFPGVLCGQPDCIPPEPTCHSSFGTAEHDHCVEPTCEKRQAVN